MKKMLYRMCQAAFIIVFAALSMSCEKTPVAEKNADKQPAATGADPSNGAGVVLEVNGRPWDGNTDIGNDIINVRPL